MNEEHDGILYVFDTKGNSMISPISLQPGENRVSVSTLISGMYFARIEVNGHSISKRFIVTD